MRASSSTLLFTSLVRAVLAGQIDYSQYVNPFIGGEGPYPGYGCKSQTLDHGSQQANMHFQMEEVTFLSELLFHSA